MARTVRFAVAIVISIALWHQVGPSWVRMVAAAAEPLVRLDSRFANSVIDVERAGVLVRSTTGTPAPIRFPVGQIIFNVALLLALFGSNPRPFGRANVVAAVAAMLVLLATHPLALVVAIESTYATRMGEWSEENYGVVATNVWFYLEMFYRLIGLFAIPFVLWWIAGVRQMRTEPRLRQRRT